MNKQTINEAIDFGSSQAKAKGMYAEDVAFLLGERLNLTPSQLEIKRDQVLTDTQQNQFQKDLKRYLQGEPPQYIIGHAWFYGEKIKVDSRVLIPRFETEELVAWVIKDVGHTMPKILDLGTGSGAIALTLVLKTQAKVVASDISADALAVARQNFAAFQQSILTIQADGLADLDVFDVVVSNPPYIMTSEVDVMDSSVKRFEPKVALFAGKDGLDFYRHFFAEIDRHLNHHGRFYVEFGYRQRSSLDHLAKELIPNYTLTFRQDINGQQRMLKGVKND